MFFAQKIPKGIPKGISKKIAPCLSIVALLALGACDMTTQSRINVNKIGIEKTIRTVQLPSSNINEKVIIQLADGYLKNGNGNLNILIGYNETKKGDKVRANRQARLYRRLFEDQGIKQIDLETVPVDGSSIVAKTLVSYNSLKAIAPKGCTRIPGHVGAGTTEDMETYSMGCETSSMMAKMVSHPASLLGGQTTAEDGDARRQGNVVENYKDGIRNEVLEGMSASEVGQ